MVKRPKLNDHFYQLLSFIPLFFPLGEFNGNHPAYEEVSWYFAGKNLS